MTKAVMTQSYSLLGTSLKLKKGDRVILTPANNLPMPDKLKWFARPVKPSEEWLEDQAILVDSRHVRYL